MSRVPVHRIDAAQLAEMRELRESGYSCRMVADTVKLPTATVYNLLSRSNLDRAIATVVATSTGKFTPAVHQSQTGVKIGRSFYDTEAEANAYLDLCWEHHIRVPEAQFHDEVARYS